MLEAKLESLAQKSAKPLTQTQVVGHHARTFVFSNHSVDSHLKLTSYRASAATRTADIPHPPFSYSLRLMQVVVIV